MVMHPGVTAASADDGRAGALAGLRPLGVW